VHDPKKRLHGNQFIEILIATFAMSTAFRYPILLNLFEPHDGCVKVAIVCELAQFQVGIDARLNSISVIKEGPQRRELLLANRRRARIPLKFADFFEIHI
jgi:hypothetical protein